MPITPSALGKANVSTSNPLKRVVGLLLGIAIHGFAGADEVDSRVKKPVADNTQEEIVTLPTVEVKTEKRAAGYRADSTTVGTKTDTPLNETPQSISIITQEQLQDQRADSLGTALRYTPGVQGETFGFNPRATSLKIRGFDSITTGLFAMGCSFARLRHRVSPSIRNRMVQNASRCCEGLLPFYMGKAAQVGSLTL